MARNVSEFGTGALNVDGCRIAALGEKIGPGSYSDPTKRQGTVGTDLGISNADKAKFQAAQAASVEKANALGRWPANILLDEEAAAMLDAQTGEVGARARARASGPTRTGRTEATVAFQGRPGTDGEAPFHADTGGASRFFYVAKASRSEREAGTGDGGNRHPTVKPVAVMRWLCRLVTPPGGIVLDPFTGSGTTGVAAVREGFRFVGIEREAEYVEIARARVAHAAAPE